MKLRTTKIDVLVFWFCCWAFTLWVAYMLGLSQGGRQCAKLAGHDPISTTADTCTFAQSYGRATTKRRAM